MHMAIMVYIFLYLHLLVVPCRLYDVPDSELIKHWGKTYRFIKEAKYVHTSKLRTVHVQHVYYSLQLLVFYVCTCMLSSNVCIYIYITLCVYIHVYRVMGTKVLVHCKMGISRSAATVSHYTYIHYCMSIRTLLYEHTYTIV